MHSKTLGAGRAVRILFGAVLLGIALYFVILQLYSAVFPPVKLIVDRLYAEHYLHLELGPGGFKRYAARTSGIVPSRLGRRGDPV